MDHAWPVGRGSRAEVAAVVVAIAIAACNQLVLRTAPAPEAACDAAVMTGHLVSSRETGLALRPAGGANVPVTWPFGYSAGGFVGSLELRDETDQVLAREGDFVQVGGGMGADGSFVVCAGTVSVIAAT
jgi:hypothetical protein